MTTRVFLAGATGVVGRRLVPALVARGYEVVGTTRHQRKTDLIRDAGAEPVVLDPLDRSAVVSAVVEAKPDVVIHQLTALGEIPLDYKRFDQHFAATNLLRTKGVHILMDAAIRAGARRFIAQSYAGWPAERTGGPVKTEDDPLDPHPVAGARNSHAAIRELESTVTGTTDIEGVVLRYGGFYGPSTGFEHGGPLLKLVQQRKLPVVGRGTGVWSLVHIDDVAAPTVAAVEEGAPGIYHITDDEPAPISEWLPYLARVVDAKPPRRVPVWLAKPMVGELGVAMMTSIRGAANGKAKATFGWRLKYPTWRQGFRSGLG
ncbi:MAG TPA: NAD(P)-dependent oxidoreductase [Natronosporangium sp.]|nr:NAD(P)-dependent oxidoreductase [Natronosporangium sp.]